MQTHPKPLEALVLASHLVFEAAIGQQEGSAPWWVEDTAAPSLHQIVVFQVSGHVPAKRYPSTTQHCFIRSAVPPS